MCLNCASSEVSYLSSCVDLQNSVHKQCSCNLPGAGKLLACKMRCSYLIERKKPINLQLFFLTDESLPFIMHSRLRTFFCCPCFFFLVSEQLRIHLWTIRSCIFTSVTYSLNSLDPLLWRLSPFMWILRICSKIIF